MHESITAQVTALIAHSAPGTIQQFEVSGVRGYVHNADKHYRIGVNGLVSPTHVERIAHGTVEKRRTRLAPHVGRIAAQIRAAKRQALRESH